MISLFLCNALHPTSFSSPIFFASLNTTETLTSSTSNSCQMYSQAQVCGAKRSHRLPLPAEGKWGKQELVWFGLLTFKIGTWVPITWFSTETGFYCSFPTWLASIRKLVWRIRLRAIPEPYSWLFCHSFLGECGLWRQFFSSSLPVDPSTVLASREELLQSVLFPRLRTPGSSFREAFLWTVPTSDSFLETLQFFLCFCFILSPFSAVLCWWLQSLVFLVLPWPFQLMNSSSCSLIVWPSTFL